MNERSQEQVFSRIARIHRRALELLDPSAAAPPVLDPAELPSDEAELRLPTLARLFHLPPLAVDALICLLAAEYDPLLRLLQRALQRDAGRPWLELGTIAELLELSPDQVPELARLFAPGQALRRWGLVLVDDRDAEVPAVASRVKIAARTADHLAGGDALPEWMRLRRPGGPSTSAPELLDALAPRVDRAFSLGEPLLIAISGRPGCGKRTLAEDLGTRLELPVLLADLAAIAPERIEAALCEAAREARIADALLCLLHLDEHLPGAAPLPSENEAPAGPRRPPRAIAELLREPPGVVLVTTSEADPRLHRLAPALIPIHVPFPTPAARASQLTAALTGLGAAPADDVDVNMVVRRYALDPRSLKAAASGALEAARRRTGAVDDPGPLATADLVEGCRAQLCHELQSVAVRVTASHRWEDLVVPADVYYGLEEILAHMRHAEQVYDRWGFGARGVPQGLSTLFSGPPGTGKTMCASVLARELDMELFRIDLSRVVSKWIGETEKNLGRVFDEAERSHAIILFDEADALFAKRTDVKSSVDRYANLEVNYLLQRMEAFSGITILTTNFEDHIDPAFKRRLTFKLRFEKPDVEARTALWRKAFPAGCRLAADVEPALLARTFEMTGANIRNAALRAAFLAAADGSEVQLTHCMLAGERECQEAGMLIHDAIPVRDDAVPPSPPPAPSPSTGNRAARTIPISHPRRASVR